MEIWFWKGTKLHIVWNIYSDDKWRRHEYQLSVVLLKERYMYMYANRNGLMKTKQSCDKFVLLRPFQLHP